MTDEATSVADVANFPVSKQEKPKGKREIIRFKGESPTAINMEHVTTLRLEANKITFEFYTKGQFVEFESNTEAESVFEMLLNIWAHQ